MAENVFVASMLIMFPAVVSFLPSALIFKYGHDQLCRYALVVPISFGFLAAYLLHPDRLPVVPDRHWQWLAYLALGAAVISGALAAERISWWERVLATAVLMFVATWQLVPTWETLQPGRHLMIPLLAAYFIAIGTLLSLLPARLRSRTFLFALAGVMLATSGYVAIEVSLKIGSSLFPAAAAFGGVWLASFIDLSRAKESLPMAIIGLLPVYALLAGGGAFVGAIELPEPRWLLLVIPAAPLMLWLFTFGPLAKLTGTTAAVAQVVAVALIPIAILAWTLLKSEPADEWSGQLEAKPKLLLNLRNRPEVEPVVGRNLALLGPLQRADVVDRGHPDLRLA
jgi:hypothetical protein